jgi:protein TonB
VARPVAEAPKIEETPPPPPAAPPLIAPVARAPADAADLPGLVDAAASMASNGPGTGGGTGTGQGTGAGEGAGAGIGQGSLTGTGGGPYRPGSGITAPVLHREVKPLYTEEARRRGIEGDVVMEVVVRSDGSVGDMRILQGLPGGLDGRAAQAVRQWSFAPARRFGTPVDVLVEVAVEFRLR